jgi:hypothetical protein
MVNKHSQKVLYYSGNESEKRVENEMYIESTITKVFRISNNIH